MPRGDVNHAAARIWVVISGLTACLIIYLPTKNYNLPRSFGPDAEFHPRLAERRCDGKFIVGRVVIRTIAVVAVVSPMGAMLTKPLMMVIAPVLANPLIPMVLAMLANQFFAVVEFVIVRVPGQAMIGPAVVMFGANALFRPMFTIAIFSAVGPGSSREYKHQPCNQQSDFQ